MTSRTRRWATCCAILAMLTVPLELLTLDLLKRGRQLTVPTGWARRMSADERSAAAYHIEDYPVQYQRALLATLPPAERASVWRRHTQGYLDRHPALTSVQRDAVSAMLQFATAEIFKNPKETSAARGAAAERVLAQLGRDGYNEVFLRTSAAGEWASALPMRAKLESFLERKMVLSAYSCNCYTGHPSLRERSARLGQR